MQTVPRKPSSFGNTPKELAKAAMKFRAGTELEMAGLSDRVSVQISYMGVTHVVEGKPTVNVDNGQIMFHFGAVGKNRLLYQVTGKDEKLVTLNMSLGGNLLTGEAIDTWQAIREQYGLNQAVVTSAPTEPTDEELEAGETT